MTSRYDRLVYAGDVVVDLVLTVSRLPERGGDVLATSTTTRTGGGFNVMSAARRLGLATVHAGVLGEGPRADAARRDLVVEGIATPLPDVPGLDTGFVVTMVEDSGERTFVTSPGAEAKLTRQHLDVVQVDDRDLVAVSGYALAYDSNRRALLDWLPSVPSDVLFDPGPLVATLPADDLDAVLGRCAWLTVNADEARALTGADDTSAQLAGLRERAPGATVLLRGDARGAVVAVPGADPVDVAAVAVTAIDSTGAGDVHTGALAAALARGDDPVAAVRFANAAAAFAVTRRGPATGPTSAELSAFLRGTG